MISNKSIIKSAASIVDTDSESKQLTMAGWAAEALQTGEIRKMSKGVIAYEVLHFAFSDTYSDEFTILERKVGNQVTEDVWGAIDNLSSKYQNQAEEELAEDSEYGIGVDVDNVEIQMPVETIDQLPDYGAGHHIADAISYVYASPWTSRQERLSDVLDLVGLLQGESLENPSDIVQSVIDGESPDYDVSELHYLVTDEIQVWEQSGFDLDDLRMVADDIPTTKDKRIAALDSAISSDDYSYAHFELVDLAQEIYGCVKSSAEKYADGVEQDVIVVNLKGMANKIADDVDSEGEIKDEFELVGVPDEVVYAVDGVYDKGDGIDIIDKMLAIEEGMGDMSKIRNSKKKKAHRKMMNYVRETKREAAKKASQGTSDVFNT